MERLAATLFLGLMSVNSYASNNAPFSHDDSYYSGAIGSTSIAPMSENNVMVTSSYRSLSRESNSNTYIKCTYSIDNDPVNPATSWVWAKHPQYPNEYAIVKGYWRDGNIITNMFYTNVSAQELKQVCQFTLRNAGIDSEVSIPYAGDSMFSYYYTFWSQGDGLPETALDGIRLDRIVAFGDSLSDTINLYNASYGAVPKNSAWFHGRFSNGRVWHEYWAETLNIPSYVWATANAESGIKPLFPGFMEQLNNFKAYLAYAQNYDIKKTLFTVLFGGNDFITGGKTSDDVIRHYRDGLNELAHLGAAQIAILTLPDFSGVPSVRDWSEADKMALREKSVIANTQLEALAQELKNSWPDTQFIVLSLDKAFNNLLTRAEALGYVNIEDTCLDLKKDTFSYMYHHNPRPACKSSGGKFIFWDYMHPTTSAHADLSEMLYQELRLKLKEAHQ